FWHTGIVVWPYCHHVVFIGVLASEKHRRTDTHENLFMTDLGTSAQADDASGFARLRRGSLAIRIQIYIRVYSQETVNTIPSFLSGSSRQASLEPGEQTNLFAPPHPDC